MIKKIFLILALLALVLSACTSGTAAQPAETQAETQLPAAETTSQQTTEATQLPEIPGAPTLTVMTHDSFAMSEGVLAAFETQNHVNVRFLKSGDAGTALNKAILSKNNPLADVFYGVDNTFLSRALSEGIYEPYNSPVLSQIPNEFKLDPTNNALPADYGDVCLNYDKVYFSNHNLQPPQSLEDLLKPEYKSLLEVENPATSSPGLSFLLTTIGHFGQDGYLTYWKNLKANDVKVVNDWETAYYTDFSAHGGTRPLVVSYNSSPPAEVLFAQTKVNEPPTGAITADDTCFRQIEFVGILKGAKNPDLAKKWVDFMLSTQFQEDMPLQMFVFPVNPNAKLPEVFTKFVVLPKKTAQVSSQDIAANREKWLEEWTAAVLR